jgi:hypothetical protein
MTVITYLDDRRVQVASPHGLFVCSINEINKEHDGVWNERVMCFVPTTVDYRKTPDWKETFSDGVPVAYYDEVYNDHCGTYYENCQVCGVYTAGDKYCGTSCDAQAIMGCV